MTRVVKEQSELLRDRQAFFEACLCMDWTKEYKCVRCESTFVVDRSDAERFMKVAWTNHGELGYGVDYYVTFEVPCPVCTYRHSLVTGRYSKGRWLSNMQKEKRKKAEEAAKQNKSFVQRLFG